MSKLLGSISLNTYVGTKDFCIEKEQILLSEEKHTAKKTHAISSRNTKRFWHKTNIFPSFSINYNKFFLKTGKWFWILDNGTLILGPCLVKLCTRPSPCCHPHVPFQPLFSPWGLRVTFSRKAFGGSLLLQKCFSKCSPCPPPLLIKVTPCTALRSLSLFQ